ncbi:MAG: hypothetical protein M0Q44_01325 [Methylobacter sp.]|nr:hypothetical protein [Methylobacter sp.]
MIPIQATIVGYSGKPCTLFSAYAEDAQVLTIVTSTAHRRDRRDGCMVITNDLNIERDGLFSEDDFSAAIAAFFSLKDGAALDGKSSRLIFSDKVAAANPSSSIEKDGMDTHGPKYRLQEITNAQVAVLATCWYAASKATTVETMLDMADKLLALDGLRHGDIWTI